MSDTRLPPPERIKILTARIRNLKRGSGEYPNDHERWKAISSAQAALDAARAELHQQQ